MSHLFFSKSLYAYFWIVVVLIVLFSKTLAFRFTHFDDDILILKNQSYLSSMSNIISSFYQPQNGFKGFYRPILSASFIIDYKIGKAEPFVYHLTNLLIHILACCLIFSLLMQLGFLIDQSFILSLLFAVHPLITQAVAWIPGRNDSILAVFIILAFKCFLYYIKTSNTAYLLSYCLSFAAALFTKETAIMLPFLAAFYLLFDYNVKEYEGKNNIHQFKLAAYGLLVIAVWFVFRKLTIVSGTTTITEQSMAVIRNLPSLINYIGKVFYPSNLAVLPTLQDMSLRNGTIVLTLLVLAVLFSRKRNNHQVMFGILWFVLFLIPTFSIKNNFFLEHRVYVPMIGIIIMTNAIIDGFEWISLKRWIFMAGVMLIPFFVVYTFIYTDNFVNHRIFWKNVVRTSPNLALAHNNLGLAYLSIGLVDEAEKEYLKALSLESNYLTLRNLAVINTQKKRYRKAEYYFKLSLFTREVPSSGRVIVLNDYAKMLYNKGDFNKSLQLVQIAESIKKLGE